MTDLLDLAEIAALAQAAAVVQDGRVMLSIPFDAAGMRTMHDYRQRMDPPTTLGLIAMYYDVYREKDAAVRMVGALSADTQRVIAEKDAEIERLKAEYKRGYRDGASAQHFADSLPE